MQSVLVGYCVRRVAFFKLRRVFHTEQLAADAVEPGTVLRVEGAALGLGRGLRRTDSAARWSGHSPSAVPND